MSGELNFEIMPFEAYDGFRTPGGFEVEKEFGRRARLARSFRASAAGHL